MNNSTDNIFFLKGFIGQDPDLKEIKGNKLVNLSIGQNVKNAKGEEKTYWHKVVAWGKLAEIIGEKYKKGMLVRIEGWLNPKVSEIEGSKYAMCDLVVNSIEKIEKI